MTSARPTSTDPTSTDPARQTSTEESLVTTPFTPAPVPAAASSATDPTQLLAEALRQVKSVVVGQDRLVERVMVSLLANGHVLIEGYPGLAKTLTVATMSRVMGGSMTRIQFTPDLVPADLVGTRIWRPSTEDFDTEWGPIFANLVLADEINRAPAKVQSALLEAMAERQVSIGGHTRALPSPFVVLATQNPIESEGVYALPEAQRDRFLMHVVVPQPTYEEETTIASRMSSHAPQASQVLTTEQLLELQRITDDVFMHDAVKDYAVRLVMATREPSRWGFDDLARHIAIGSSPRGTLSLLAAARGIAVLRGRRFIVPQDVFDVAPEVLRHRVTLTYDALAEGVAPDAVIREVLSRVPAPRIAATAEAPVRVDAAAPPSAGYPTAAYPTDSAAPANPAPVNPAPAAPVPAHPVPANPGSPVPGFDGTQAAG